MSFFCSKRLFLQKVGYVYNKLKLSCERQNLCKAQVEKWMLLLFIHSTNVENIVWQYASHCRDNGGQCRYTPACTGRYRKVNTIWQKLCPRKQRALWGHMGGTPAQAWEVTEISLEPFISNRDLKLSQSQGCKEQREEMFQKKGKTYAKTLKWERTEHILGKIQNGSWKREPI